MSTPLFRRYVGIDYSGAEVPTSSLKGIRVYQAEDDGEPCEVPPPPSQRKYWTRSGLATWLIEMFAENVPTIVGIDHGLSFPLRYFETHHLPPDWDAFLVDFCEHWPTDDPHMYVDAIREGRNGKGDLRAGSARWRRIVEKRTGAKSVFHFDVPGSVAKSTHAGLPWILKIRQECGESVHIWPFDGWQIPAGSSVLAEVYPALWKASYPRGQRTPDQHDAFVVATWLQQGDRSGVLPGYLEPPLDPGIQAEAEIEGWILGVQ